MAVSPMKDVRKVLDYAVTVIPPAIIDLGIPNYGYDWKLPFVEGTTKAKSIGNEEAIDITRDNHAEIEYDTDAEAPYFNYYSPEKELHEVWFEDARSIKAKLQLIAEYGLNGCGYWNVMRPFVQNWMIVAILYDIEKKYYGNEVD